jgi:site-specific recombinase XerD
MIESSVPITLTSHHSELAVPSNINTTLSASATARIKAAAPESTRRAYGGDWDRFGTWCAETGHDPLPATPQTVADYVDSLANTNKAPGTIRRAMASISVAHRDAGVDIPDQILARKVLTRYRQERAERGETVRKAEAVTIDHLRAMISTLDPSTPVGVRDRALIVLGFALGVRRAELAALNIVELKFTPAGIEVWIRRSKTDQEALGRTVAVPYGAQLETCPVRSVQAWLELLAANGRAAGPLFVRIDRHGKFGRSPTGGSRDGRLSAQAVALVVNRTARRAGLDPTAAWSGHSLRRGFATETYRAGADPLRIARHGGWRDGSRTLLGYIEEVDRWEANPLAKVGL